MATIIRIEPIYYKQITKYAAQPNVDKVLLDEDQIKEICLFPALEEYFIHFPKKEYTQKEIAVGANEIPWPDDDTFGVSDARLVDKSTGNSMQGSSSFIDLVRYNSIGGGGITALYGNRSRYGGNRASYGMMKSPRFAPEGLQYQFITNRLMQNSITEIGTFKVMVDYDRRVVLAAPTTNCSVAITWAKMSRDFSDVRVTQRLHTLKLAGANYLEYIADVGALMDDTTAEKKIDAQALKDRAEKLRTEVMDLWNKLPHPVLFRSS